MTRDEALREIGLDPGSSPDEIRRAYLRMVKIRKPESDPEGFRRLREAFEILRGLPEAPPEIRPHPRPVEKRPVRPKAEPEEVVEPEEALPPPHQVVRLLLELQAEGQAAEAERLQEQFQQRLESASRELSLLDDETAALWQIAREISGLSTDFSTSTRVAISAAVLRGAPDLAIPQLLAQVGEDGDAGWRMVAEIKDLPGLGSLYHDTLVEALEDRNRQRRSSAEERSWSPQKVFGVLIGLWFLAQASTSLFGPSISAPTHPLPYPFSYRPAPARSPAPASEFPREEMLLACPPGRLDVPDHAAFCEAVQTAFLHLGQRRCQPILEDRERLLERLRRMRGSALEQPAQDLFDSLRAGYVTICQDYSF